MSYISKRRVLSYSGRIPSVIFTRLGLRRVVSFIESIMNYLYRGLTFCSYPGLCPQPAQSNYLHFSVVLTCGVSGIDKKEERATG